MIRHMFADDVSHALRPAVRLGFVHKVGDKWEWAA